MAVKTMTLAKYERMARLHPEDPFYQGAGQSPGGAAGELGMSRQSVHKACERGDLEAVRVVRSLLDGGLVLFLIRPASIQRYKRIREMRAAASA